MMKRLLLFFGSLLCSCLVVLTGTIICFADSPKKETVVLTSLDVVQAMAEAVTRDTSIRVVNVIPQGYFMQGQDSYLKKHRKEFLAMAAGADAVLTAKAAWEGDPLYKWARRGNIHVVNIDVSQPLDGYGAGVPLMEIDGRYSPYVWRSPANLTRMAVIAADDLARLVPGESETIRHNLKEFQSALFKLRSRYEAAFLELDSVDLAALTDGYTYLADEFGLDVHFHSLKPESRWTEKDVREFASRLRKDSVRGVLCAWTPDENVLRAIIDGGASSVELKRFVRSKGTAPIKDIVNWYDGNLSRLLTALKH